MMEGRTVEGCREKKNCQFELVLPKTKLFIVKKNSYTILSLDCAPTIYSFCFHL